MKKVILVDDSSVIHIQVEIICKELIDSNTISLNMYTNPAELLNGIKSESIDFDLLITDINMIQMNGLELVKHVRGIDRFHKKPIIIMTTETDESLIEKAKQLNITGWIVKPPKTIKFVKALKIALQIS